MAQLQDILKFPAAYRLLGRLMRKDCRPVYVRDYLKVQPHERVLDLGCGPGDILSYLPTCEYLGVDIDAAYIKAAQQRFGTRGTFVCKSVDQFVVEQAGSFDLVMANGVLHHLNDREALALLRTAAIALKPGGRLVTLDGCFVPGQSWVAKMLLRMDRGEFIRAEPQYDALARSCFAQVDRSVRHDLHNLPYTVIIMTSRQQRAA